MPHRISPPVDVSRPERFRLARPELRHRGRSSLLGMLFALWALAVSGQAHAVDGRVRVHFKISAGQLYSNGVIDSRGALVWEPVGGPSTCPVGGVTFNYGGHWVNYLGFWFWIWAGATPIAGLVPEQTTEIQGFCRNGGCTYVANVYCDYPIASQINTNYPVPAGIISASVLLSCPVNNQFRATTPAATSPNTTLPAGGSISIDLGSRLGNGASNDGDAASFWSTWASQCGLSVPLP
jgi:hypothetical protein